jgi:cytochrome c heme-lyase
MMTGQCPVDHHSAETANEECPVKNPQSSSWFTHLFSRSSSQPPSSSPSSPSSSSTPHHHPLSTDRTPSTIPKADSSTETWTYPSEAQFFSALKRKNHQANASDMKYIVPIHNAVNERTWVEIMNWERGRGGESCGGLKLVNFMGKPGERTWKAWAKVLLGSVFIYVFLVIYWVRLRMDRYTPPFDRHDWVVDRCGTRMRYIIDFYTGRSSSPDNLSFYLDVRPAMDSWEGVKMRMERFWERWVGKLKE